MSSSFSASLSKCLSPVTELRKEGEAFLEQKCSESYGDLLSEIANILIDEGFDFKLRQLCATLIKNLLNKAQYQGKWDALPSALRDSIKNKALACLASTSLEICNLTALAIASICRREIPRGQWSEIVSILFNTSQNSNPAYRLSSVITIGYIAQDLKEGDLTQEQVNHFLSALISNLCPGNDLLFKYTAISFVNILLFAKNNFANETERGIILDKIISLAKDTTIPSEIRAYLLQASIEVIRLYYVFIVDRINEIAAVTCAYMKCKDSKLAISAIEFWCSLCEEETFRQSNCPETSFGFAKKFNVELFASITEVLLDRNGSITVEEEWTPLKGVVCLIENMALCAGMDFLNTVLAFVGKYLKDSSTAMRDSAYLAFGSLLVSSQLGFDILKSSLPQLFNELNQQGGDLKLKRTVAWCFCQLCEYHCDIFNEEELFDSTIRSLMEIFQAYSSTPVLLVKLFEALREIVTKCPNKLYLNKHLMNLLNLLLKMAYLKGSFNTEANVTEAAFFIISKLIQHSPNDTSNEVLSQFFAEIFQLLSDSFNQSLFSSPNEQMEYQNYLEMVITSSCSNQKIKMNFEQLSSVYKLIKQTFINRQCVYEVGLLACSSLAYASPSAFLSILDDYVGYLLIGLQSFKEESLCSLSITSTSDLLFSLKNQFSPYLSSFIEVIFTILNEANCDKFLKTKCFIVLTDIFFITTMTESYNYYQRAMEVATNAMTAALTPTQEDDDTELVEYFLLLRERIIEFLSCVIAFLDEHKKVLEFECFVPRVMEFINTICQQSYSPTVIIMMDSLGLIGDMCSKFKGKVRQYLHRPVLTFIFASLNGIKSEAIQKMFEWANEVSLPPLHLLFNRSLEKNSTPTRDIAIQSIRIIK